MDGVLYVNKPAGYTSFDVVAKLRQALHIKRIGHTGTLDPQATGLLIILVGKATKILPYLSDSSKSYEASFQLGYETDTWDQWGKKVKEAAINPFDLDDILASLEGKQRWQVPQVSNKKVNGKKLLDYHRQGLNVPVVYQEVTIHKLKALGPQRFCVHCSSGTYVRSLIHEIGQKTHNLATMDALIRTGIGQVSLSQAQSLDACLTEPVFHPITELLTDEQVIVDDPTIFMQGKKVPLQAKHQRVLIMHQTKPIALYEQEGDLYRCLRGLF